MSCSCGNEQRTSGIAPANVEGMKPINGVSAEILFRMKLNDAVKVCKTLDDYKALGRIKNYKPGWATAVYSRVEQMRNRFKRRAY